MSAKEIQENHNLTEGERNSGYRSHLLSQDETKSLLFYPTRHQIQVPTKCAVNWVSFIFKYTATSYLSIKYDLVKLQNSVLEDIKICKVLSFGFRVSGPQAAALLPLEGMVCATANSSCLNLLECSTYWSSFTAYRCQRHCLNTWTRSRSILQDPSREEGPRLPSLWDSYHLWEVQHRLSRKMSISPQIQRRTVSDVLTKCHVPRCNLTTLETPWFKPASKWWERQEEEAGGLANGLQISSPDVAHFWSTPAVISISAFKVSFPAFFSPVAGIGVKFPLYGKYHVCFFFFFLSLCSDLWAY